MHILLFEGTLVPGMVAQANSQVRGHLESMLNLSTQTRNHVSNVTSATTDVTDPSR